MTTIETAEAPPGTSASILAALWQASLPSEREIRRGRLRLQAKAASIAITIAASYWALVIADFALWARVLAGGAIVAALVATGTGIMHDANHGAFSSRRWINRVASCSADFLGASSWLWRFKHNRLHHGNTNVDAFDSDIAQEPFARLAPCQQWRPWHQWQHVYLWFLYGFFALKNVIFGDVRNLVDNRIGKQPLPADMRRSTVVRLVVGKFVHISWAVVVPMLFNPWWKVVLFYVACSWLVGFALAVVFQLAHCVDIAGFPDEDAGRRGGDFLEHQLLTTVDIASPMPVLGHAFRWMVGGLDHQIEHHMAPRLPHTVYPLVARRFHALCNDAGISVRLHPGVWAALCSHTRWLMDMGRRPLAA